VPRADTQGNDGNLLHRDAFLRTLKSELSIPSLELDNSPLITYCNCESPFAYCPTTHRLDRGSLKSLHQQHSVQTTERK
jgi:hypothetical protein